MSKPVFQDLFSFSARRNRKSYILQSLAFVGIAMGLSLLSVILGAIIAPVGVFLGIVASLMTVVMLVASIASGSQRLRDSGFSGAWIVLTLVPIVNLPFWVFLLVYPGQTAEDNKYGPSLVK